MFTMYLVQSIYMYKPYFTKELNKTIKDNFWCHQIGLTGVRIGWSLMIKVNSNVQYIAWVLLWNENHGYIKKDNISAYKA